MAKKSKKGSGCTKKTYATKAIAARVAGGHKKRGKKVTVTGRTVTACG